MAQQFGMDVLGVGDVDRDGVTDLAVGVPNRGTPVNANGGQVVIVSGADGSVIARAQDETDANTGYLGWSLALVPDMDGDGLDDILAGAKVNNVNGLGPAGRIIVFSVADGTLIARFDPSETRDLLFATDKRTLSWLEPFDPGCSSGSLFYNTLKTPDATDFEQEMTCLESADPDDLVAEDSGVPAVGVCWFYLTHARNRCGAGSLGTWGEGDPRHGAECP